MSIKLLEQANSHVIEVNKLMGEVEAVENVINTVKVQDQVISFTQKGIGTTYLDNVLSQEELGVLKEAVMVCIMQSRDDKIAALEKLLGIRKPEANSQVEPIKEAEPKSPAKSPAKKKTSDPVPPVEPKKVEFTRDELYKMFITDDIAVKDIAAKYGITTSAVYRELSKYGLADLKKTKRKDDKVKSNRP